MSGLATSPWLSAYEKPTMPMSLAWSIGPKSKRVLSDTCQTGANMWKARAIVSRMSMSSCAPRVCSTGMRMKSMRPDESFFFAVTACEAAAFGAGKKKMKRPEKAVSAMESSIASW
eukprot:scaffold1018_cov59-Phaeocystis_antarctica.AAC.2